MPDQSQTSPFTFACQGGLVLNQPTFNMQPGQALELLNFEPDIDGGYRRISGYKYLDSSHTRPAGTGAALGVFIYNFEIYEIRLFPPLNFFELMFIKIYIIINPKIIPYID